MDPACPVAGHTHRRTHPHPRTLAHSRRRPAVVTAVMLASRSGKFPAGLGRGRRCTQVSASRTRKASPGKAQRTRPGGTAPVGRGVGGGEGAGKGIGLWRLETWDAELTLFPLGPDLRTVAANFPAPPKSPRPLLGPALPVRISAWVPPVCGERAGASPWSAHRQGQHAAPMGSQSLWALLQGGGGGPAVLVETYTLALPWEGVNPHRIIPAPQCQTAHRDPAGEDWALQRRVGRKKKRDWGGGCGRSHRRGFFCFQV